MTKATTKRNKKANDGESKADKASQDKMLDELPATVAPASKDQSESDSILESNASAGSIVDPIARDGSTEIIDQQLPKNLDTEADLRKRKKQQKTALPVARIYSGTAALKLPIAETGDYVLRRPRIDIRDLSRKQRRGLNLLMEGMSCEGCRLENGNLVNNHPNALRKLFELVADEAPDN